MLSVKTARVGYLRSAYWNGRATSWLMIAHGRFARAGLPRSNQWMESDRDALMRAGGPADSHRIIAPRFAFVVAGRCASSAWPVLFKEDERRGGVLALATMSPTSTIYTHGKRNGRDGHRNRERTRALPPRIGWAAAGDQNEAVLDAVRHPLHLAAAHCFAMEWTYRPGLRRRRIFDPLRVETPAGRSGLSAGP